MVCKATSEIRSKGQGITTKRLTKLMNQNTYKQKVNSADFTQFYSTTFLYLAPGLLRVCAGLRRHEVDSTHSGPRSAAHSLIQSLFPGFFHVEEKTGAQKGQKGWVSDCTEDKAQCRIIVDDIVYYLQHADQDDTEDNQEDIEMYKVNTHAKKYMT